MIGHHSSSLTGTVGWVLFLLIWLMAYHLSFIPRVFAGSPRDDVGTSGAQFLKLPVNARAIAMGEAYSAVADGSDAIYWNPSGLGRIEGKALSVMHAVYFQDSFYDFASYAQKMGSIGTLGVGIQFLSANSIDETDEFGANVGTFKPNDLAISVGWAREVQDIFGDTTILLGVAGKFIRSRIIESATAGAFDFGFSLSPMEKLRLSAGVQNIGPRLKFKDQGDNLPLNVRIGSSYELYEFLLLALDANFPRDNDPNAAFGVEYKRQILERTSIAGRVGYNSRTTTDIKKGISSVSAGVGFIWSSYGIDFAWVPFGNLGNTYRVSLSAKF